MVTSNRGRGQGGRREGERGGGTNASYDIMVSPHCLRISWSWTTHSWEHYSIFKGKPVSMVRGKNMKTCRTTGVRKRDGRVVVGGGGGGGGGGVSAIGRSTGKLREGVKCSRGNNVPMTVQLS